MSEAPVTVVTAAGTVPDALAGTDVRVVDPAAVDTDTFGTTEVVVAVGEPSLLSAARRRPDAPIAPVSTGSDRYDVPGAALGAVVDAVAEGDLRTTAHPVLDVAVDGDDAGTAIADVTLLTAAPARISEFGVAADGWRASVRADGVVVATPLGSTGYARDAGGPELAPDTGLVAVPISAYAMHARPWVLRPPLSLSVERDEADVTLRLDDAAVRSVPPNAPVEVTAGEPLRFVSPRQFRPE